MRIKLLYAAGILASALTLYLVVALNVMLSSIPEAPISRVRLEALSFSLASTLFSLSFAAGVLAIATRRERRSLYFMAFSTTTAFFGHVSLCIRLILLKHLNALFQSLIIALIHITLLTITLLQIKLIQRS